MASVLSRSRNTARIPFSRSVSKGITSGEATIASGKKDARKRALPLVFEGALSFDEKRFVFVDVVISLRLPIFFTPSVVFLREE